MGLYGFKTIRSKLPVPNTKKKNKKTRLRGVKASRKKLEQALHKSGFKTQAALAEKIAMIEGIDSAPKDLVSKAFREILIEPQSLERIAAALNVEAFTLYQNQDDIKSSEVYSTNTSLDSLSVPPRFIITILLAIAITFLITWFTFSSSSSFINTKLSLPGLKPSLLIYPQNKRLYPIANQLQSIFDKSFQVTIVPLAFNQFKHSPAALKKEFQSDWVMSAEVLQNGRYSGIRVYLSNGQFDFLLAIENTSQNDMLPGLFLKPITQANLRESTAALIRSQKPLNKDKLLSKQQHLNYLSARELIEDYQSFEALDNAQLLAEQVLREHASFGPAYALQCEISIHRSWRENEKNRLEKANQQCQKALILAPHDFYVQSVIGFLHNKTGQRELAKKQFEKVLQKHTTNVEALMGLASVYFNQYRNTGNNEELEQAAGYARQAVLILKDYWRPYQLLAIIEFTAGNRENAIKAWESQVAFKPNELTLSNLGLMYLCKAEFDKSLNKFHTARLLAPNSYMPLEGLAAISYYQADFQKSLQLRLNVQNLVSNENAGIHQQWGNLADSYRQLDRITESRDAYRNALMILERDHLRGNTSQDDLIYRLYYQAQISQSPNIQRQLIIQIEELETNQLSPPALAKKAMLLKLLGQKAKSRTLFHLAAEQCPIYEKLPEFIP